ncbi:MAG TPA: ParA family protein [Caulobacteraceae bacterium]|nr:ParA family protein [Caulobacteraceae bacterium]
MLTVVFASPKGGCGKTTAALTLALGLCEQHDRVAMVDADPNRPLVRWAEMPGRPPGLTVQAAPTAMDIPDAVRAALRGRPDWLIADTEGSMAGMGAIQALKPDLIVTPLGPSPLDVDMALSAQSMLALPKMRLSKPALHCALLTRVPPLLRPRSLKAATTRLEQSGMPLLPTAVIDKEALRLLFAYGGGFEALVARQVPGAAAARANALDLATVMRSAALARGLIAAL